MTARTRFARLRHPLAALLAVGGVVVGSVAAVSGSPASAADGDLVATTSYSCKIGSFPSSSWEGELTLTAMRPAGSTTVEVRAVLSEMTGNRSPAPLNNSFTNKLTLDIDGAAVELTGSGTVVAAPGADFEMPELRGTFTSGEPTVDVTVTRYDFSIPDFDMNGVCTPTAGAAIGTLTLGEGTLPPPIPTVTTTVTATATPTAGESAPAPGGKAGKPAKGKATFACKLNIGSTFDYDATVSVSGYRAEEGDDLSLTATMSKLPGISPVPINGKMDYSLGLKVGGKAVTLTSQLDLNVPANQDVAVANLTGTLALEGDEHEVEAESFGFDFPSGGISADCTGGAVLGKMVVGSEPADEKEPETSPPGGGTSTSSGGTLPKTGGGDSLPVVGLWALALTLLGAAGLLCVPQVARKRS